MTERDDDVIREEEEAAAAEARRICGSPGDMDLDPAERPLVEGGEGESEGFELAEQDLVEHAEYTSGAGAPRLEELGDDEAEPDRATFSEPDEEDVTEVTEDPREGPDDPGRGPGITADR